jgi:hypothetical protein
VPAFVVENKKAFAELKMQMKMIESQNQEMQKELSKH